MTGDGRELDVELTAPVRNEWQRLRDWPRRRWVVAGISAASVVAFIGLSTAMIPNPIFGREVATTWWAWPVLLITAVLSGLLTATYVRDPNAPSPARRFGIAGGLLSYFAVGCPVCNKIALLALGYTGALQWFAPVQPLLGVGAVGLLGYALWRRLRGEIACETPSAA